MFSEEERPAIVEFSIKKIGSKGEWNREGVSRRNQSGRKVLILVLFTGGVCEFICMKVGVLEGDLTHP